MTGATGFVGSHLVDALQSRSARFRVLARASSDTRRARAAGAEVVIADQTDAAAIEAALADVTVVFHLAAATRAPNEGAFERANVDVTRALVTALGAARERPRLVHLSSLAAVGPTREGRPVREEDTPRPLTAYGRTKLAAERIVLGQSAVPAVVLRPPAVYGPRDRDLFAFFRMARLGLMPVPPGPDRPVQMIHVRDLVAALLVAAESEGHQGVYHVADPVERPWSAIAALIAAAVGTRPRRLRIPSPLLWSAAFATELVARLSGGASIFSRDKVRELLAPGWTCETERARVELGFTAATPLERGVAETAAWYVDEGWLSPAT